MSFNKPILFPIIALSFTVISFAQNSEEPLITDRPDFTESTETVPVGKYQFEFGYSFNRIGSNKEHVIGEFLARIPVHQLIEIRTGLNSYVIARTPSNNQSGLGDASLGFKIKFMDESEESFLGDLQTAFLLATTVPTGNEDFGENEFQPEIKFAFSLPLSKKLSAASNLNFHYASEGGNRYSQFSNSLSLGYSLSDQFGAYLEYYGSSPGSNNGPDTSYLNGGFTYLFSNDFQIDARAGKGLNGIESEYFVGFGAAARF